MSPLFIGISISLHFQIPWQRPCSMSHKLWQHLIFVSMIGSGQCPYHKAWHRLARVVFSFWWMLSFGQCWLLGFVQHFIILAIFDTASLFTSNNMLLSFYTHLLSYLVWLLFLQHWVFSDTVDINIKGIISWQKSQFSQDFYWILFYEVSLIVNQLLFR